MAAEIFNFCCSIWEFFFPLFSASLDELPDPGIEPAFSALQVDSLPLSHLGSPHITLDYCINAINAFSFNFVLPNRNSALPVHSFFH